MHMKSDSPLELARLLARQPLRLTLDDDTGLFSGQLKCLREELARLTKNIQQHDGLIEPCTWARIQDQLQTLEIALLGLECDTCEAFATVDREAGQFCQSCADRYAVCAGCGQDVKLDEAIACSRFNPYTRELDEVQYHAICAPDEFEHRGPETGR